VAGDTNGAADVFVWDRETGVTERVSVASDGNQANASPYYELSISVDGHWITYQSMASNLAANDTNDTWDVFLSTNPLAG